MAPTTVIDLSGDEPVVLRQGRARSLHWAWVDGATLTPRLTAQVIFQPQPHRFGQAGAESGVQQQGFFTRV